MEALCRAQTNLGLLRMHADKAKVCLEQSNHKFVQFHLQLKVTCSSKAQAQGGTDLSAELTGFRLGMSDNLDAAVHQKNRHLTNLCVCHSGDFVLLTWPGELSVRIGLEVKKRCSTHPSDVTTIQKVVHLLPSLHRIGPRITTLSLLATPMDTYTIRQQTSSCDSLDGRRCEKKKIGNRSGLPSSLSFCLQLTQ